MTTTPKKPKKVRKTKVTCKFCGERVPKETAHRHNGSWVGDVCCWDERLRSTE